MSDAEHPDSDEEHDGPSDAGVTSEEDTAVTITFHSLSPAHKEMVGEMRSKNVPIEEEMAANLRPQAEDVIHQLYQVDRYQNQQQAQQPDQG
jgi:hypothetical protein